MINHISKVAWLDESSVFITVKIIDLCNTSCIHCNVFGKDRKLLPIEVIQHMDDMIYNLIDNGINHFEFSFIGGEITLIDIQYLTLFFSEYHKLIKKIQLNKKVVFTNCIISNFIIPEQKKKIYFDMFESLLLLNEENIRYSINTSFDIGLNRFKNDRIYELWKNNCTEFKHALSLLVTMNTQTCNSFDYVLKDKFFDLFEKICIQPVIEFDNTLPDIVPDYDLFKNTLEKIRGNKLNKSKIQLDYKKIAYSVNINHDETVSINVSENISSVSKSLHFKLKDFKENKDNFWPELVKFKNNRIKQSRNKNCIICENFQDCDFGFENFKYQCPKFIR